MEIEKEIRRAMARSFGDYECEECGHDLRAHEGGVGCARRIPVSHDRTRRCGCTALE